MTRRDVARCGVYGVFSWGLFAWVGNVPDYLLAWVAVWLIVIGGLAAWHGGRWLLGLPDWSDDE